jgi:surface polysaccharide O-acyltransferase-like enzyme
LTIAKKERIIYFDVLRTVAILCVILCHAARIYPFVNTSLKLAIPSFLNIIGLVGVPIFFMISGALLLNKEYTISGFLKKRFSRILFPFIFWLVISIILGVMFFDFNSGQIYKLIFGEKVYTWYVWVIMGIYLFVPVINSFVKEYSIKGLEYFLIIWLVTIILQTLGMYPFHRFELSYFSGCLGYFVLGFYLSNKEFKISSKMLRVIGLLLFIFGALVLMYLDFNGIKLEGSSYLNIFVVLESSGLYILFKELFKNQTVSRDNSKNGIFKKIILSISICSYSMYFVHVIVLNYIKTFSIHSMKLFPLIYIVIVVSSWLISLGISKLPIIGEISGVK